MTDKELMQQTLYTLEHFYENGYDREDCFAAIASLIERLAREEQELVMWERREDGKIGPYTPQRREWVGLTDEEIWKYWWDRPEVPDGEDDSMEAEFVSAVRAIEAKLREKNGGAA